MFKSKSKINNWSKRKTNCKSKTKSKNRKKKYE